MLISSPCQFSALLGVCTSSDAVPGAIAEGICNKLKTVAVKSKKELSEVKGKVGTSVT